MRFGTQPRYLAHVPHVHTRLRNSMKHFAIHYP